MIASFQGTQSDYDGARFAITAYHFLTFVLSTVTPFSTAFFSWSV